MKLCPLRRRLGAGLNSASYLPDLSVDHQQVGEMARPDTGKGQTQVEHRFFPLVVKPTLKLKTLVQQVRAQPD